MCVVTAGGGYGIRKSNRAQGNQYLSSTAMSAVMRLATELGRRSWNQVMGAWTIVFTKLMYISLARARVPYVLHWWDAFAELNSVCVPRLSR